MCLSLPGHLRLISGSTWGLHGRRELNPTICPVTSIAQTHRHSTRMNIHNKSINDLIIKIYGPAFSFLLFFSFLLPPLPPILPLSPSLSHTPPSSFSPISLSSLFPSFSFSISLLFPLLPLILPRLSSNFSNPLLQPSKCGDYIQVTMCGLIPVFQEEFALLILLII